MNLSAYENVNREFNTWIHPVYKNLYSRTLPIYKYYTLLRKYNPNLNQYEYYLVLTNTIVKGFIMNTVIIDASNRIKIHLNQIWKYIANRFKGITEVNLEIDDKQDDGVIYKLDI